MIRVPPKADPDLRAAFEDTERRLRALESAADVASAAELSIIRDDLLRLRGELRRALGELRLDASQITYLPPSTAHQYNVQKALEELEFRTATPYDDKPEYFWPAPSALMYLSGTFTHNSTGNFIPITVNLTSFDNNSMADTANNRIVIRTAGVYLLQGQSQFALNGTGQRAVAIYVNGAEATPSGRVQNPGNASYALTMGATLLKPLVRGDLITLYAFQDSGGNLTMSSAFTFLSAQWMRL